MDSLSQIVLGAGVGELMLGRRIGNRALLIGAIGGTIPDLDILFNFLYSDEITKLQIHRGYSHSMFVHLILAFPFAWLNFRIWKKRIELRYLYLTWYLIFFTHTLLDCCTTYGTQLFLPFSNYLVGFNNISVVDPLWTMPFFLLLLVVLFLHRDRPLRRKLAWGGMIWGIFYMGFTMINKWGVHEHMSNSLKQQNIQFDELSTSPSIFNNILWAGIATTPDSIYLGEYSVLQEDPTIDWVVYPRHLELLDNHPAQREIGVLQWFSQGKYFVVPDGNELDLFQVKWGRMDFTQTEPYKAIVFHWRIFEENGKWQAEPVENEFGQAEAAEAFRLLWKRLFEKYPFNSK